jgi:NAD(P)-dependent dehydrogenase (short-subunit alcohol dehydrogenase family)
MRPQPDSDLSNYRAAGKLAGKVTLITGADPGIGRAVAIACAMQGADIAFAFNHSEGDAAETRRLVEQAGRRCLPLMADVTVESDRARLMTEMVDVLGRLDVLVNNAAYFEGDGTLEQIDAAGLRLVFETNIIAYMLMAQAALPHLLKAGGCIINTSSTTSILGKRGSLPIPAPRAGERLHQVARTRACRARRTVNAVLPGPFWTSAIATSNERTVASFGSFTMLGRAGQPEEIAPAYVFLAADGSFVTGALLEVSGGFKSVD